MNKKIEARRKAKANFFKKKKEKKKLIHSHPYLNNPEEAYKNNENNYQSNGWQILENNGVRNSRC